MASEWRETTIGEQMPLQRGFDITEKTAGTGHVPVISSSGLCYRTDKAMVNGPGVVIGRKGTLGTVFYIGEDFWPSDTTLWVTDFKGNDRKYVYYFYKLLSEEMLSLDVGSANPTLNRNHLHSRAALIPSPKTQRAIASILSAFDDKIELNRRMNRTLEQMARALFKSWFVDFDPVRARMRGEQPEGMDAETAALFPDELVEVEGREVPRGWANAPFDSNLVIFGGGTPKTTNPDFWGGSISWYSVVDVPNEGDVWVLQTEKTITQAGLEGSSTRLLPPGTTIISARGTVGKLALTAEPMAMNQSCYGLFPEDGKSINFTFFSTLAVVDELKRRTHGAVFDTITRGTLQSITAVVPDAAVLAAFEEQSSKLTQGILSNLRESAHLAQLRDTLLPRLLSGELDVSGWAEAGAVPV